MPRHVLIIIMVDNLLIMRSIVVLAIVVQPRQLFVILIVLKLVDDVFLVVDHGDCLFAIATSKLIFRLMHLAEARHRVHLFFWLVLLLLLLSVRLFVFVPTVNLLFEVLIGIG